MRSSRANRVLRNVNGVQDSVLAEHVCQIDCKLIIKQVAVEVDNFQMFVNEHGIQEVSSSEVLESVVR